MKCFCCSKTLDVIHCDELLVAATVVTDCVGFGSAFDELKIKFAVCDGCLNEKSEDIQVLCNYMDGEGVNQEPVTLKRLIQRKSLYTMSALDSELGVDQDFPVGSIATR